MFVCFSVSSAAAREVAQCEMGQHEIREEIDRPLERATRLLRVTLFEQDDRAQVMAGGVELLGRDPPVAPGEGLGEFTLVGRGTRQRGKLRRCGHGPWFHWRWRLDRRLRRRSDDV